MQKVTAKNGSRRKHPSHNAIMEGFYRVNLVETQGKDKGRVLGDSGWGHNLITSEGLTAFFTKTILRTAGSSSIHYVQLGSAASALASNGSSLVGEFAKSNMVSVTSAMTTRAASTDGDTARFTGTFASNFAGASSTVAGIGLYYSSGAESIFCGGSFASSTFGTTQAINVTYDLVMLASIS